MMKRLAVQLRYLRALSRRFRLTLGFCAILFGLGPVLFSWRFSAAGVPLSFGQALHHVYFLLFGQPSLPYLGDWVVETLNLLIPPLGIALVVDGVVRFAYLFFAKHRSDKEWIAVIAESLEGHVVVCGAGRVGFRVTEELLAMGKDVLVVEKREDAAFVPTLRDRQVPLLIDDTRSPHCLERLHTKKAAAIVCATDDDLANLNVALDARRINPRIRVVIRLFDDDLVHKVKDAFRAEALSTSALAAPAMALSALDPRILHSFRIESHLLVVSAFTANATLAGMTLSDLRDRFGGLTLSLRRAQAAEVLHPKGNTVVEAGDVLTVQLTYASYVALREHTGEADPPVSAPELTPLPSLAHVGGR